MEEKKIIKLLYAVLALTVVIIGLLLRPNKPKGGVTDEGGEIETAGLCMDSSDREPEHFELATFVPQAPRYLVLHCSGSPRDQSMGELYKIFQDTWGPGTRPGYNQCINFSGGVYNFAPINDNDVLDFNEICNGAKGYNAVSIHLGITGGRDKNTITAKQKEVLGHLIWYYKWRFPDIQVIGHRELVSPDLNHNGVIDPNEFVKECPRFKVLGIF